MKRSLLICFCMLVCASCKLSAQIFGSFDPHDDVFNYQVKVVDEFFERFNDNENSFIREVFRKQHKQFGFTRRELIASLFNLEDKSLTGDTTLRRFFTEVTNKSKPVFIDFTDSNWFAEARFFVEIDGKEMELPVILHVKSKPHDWSKWMIAGVGPMKASNEPKSGIKPEEFKIKPAPKFISPTAVSTDFIELHYVFANNIDPSNFFDEKFAKSARGKEFIGQILADKMHFLYCKDIVFYFYQVPNWVFSVSYFRRQSLNNGWLINSMKAINEKNKAALIQKMLYN